jgi:hypothetical protein
MEYLNTTFSPALPFRELCIGEVRERKARLCDVFLESPTVGLLGLRIFRITGSWIAGIQPAFTRNSEGGIR